jgi:hypothetical protein
MNYQLVKDDNGNVTGVYIDSIFYKVVGVGKRTADGFTTNSTPNAREANTNADYSWEWYLENEGDLYTLKNAPNEPVKTQTKSSFWDGFTADKVFSGIVKGLTSIFGNRSTETVNPAVYGSNPYLVPQTSSNNNTLLLIFAAVVVLFFFKGSNTKTN